MVKIITMDKEDKKRRNNFIKLFLSLPKKLYNKKDLVQDKKTEKEILLETHALSKYFEIYPVIIIDEKNILGRCILTYYPDDENAYVGFFECIDNQDICNRLLNFIENKVFFDGKTKLIGPVNCSVWIGYRFKIEREGYFTGEPHNKSYYPEMFKNFGFQVTDKFISNYTDIIDDGSFNLKYHSRPEKMIERGITFKNIDMNNFQNELSEIYKLEMELFKEFKGFFPIKEEEYLELFYPLKDIIDPDMIFLAYDKEKLVGFLVTYPDIKNYHLNINPINLLKLLKLKNNPKRYIYMYLGVKDGYFGLGSALIELSRRKIIEKKSKAIGALIHEGKVTGSYFNESYTEKDHYVLMEKIVK